jgi:hypothetical protein
VFFTGYNYHLRYYNIVRKIDDLEKNAQRLQKIVNDDYKPLIFKGGEIQKKGKKIFDVKEIKIHLKSKISKDSSFKKKITSLPYTEECKYYLMIEIISETTQYCADLASIIIGLKEFNTNKVTFSQINDASIKKWYINLEEPSLKDFVKIFDLVPLNELTLEERFIIDLKHEKLLWNLKKIGRFYWYNYDYIYTPFRHGMKSSFYKDSENHVYCRTLTKDKRWNLYYLSDERISKCKEIADLIFTIFHNDLKPILFSKIISPSLGKLRFQLSDAPKLPIRSFDPEIIQKEFTSLKNIKINSFYTKDIASIHDFAKISENNINFKYKKMKKGTSFFKIDGSDYYLDSFFSFSKKLKKDEFIIICNSPLAYFIELAYICITSHEIHDFKIKQIKESILHYLTIEKELDFLLNDPSKIFNRIEQFKALTNEIIKDFILLVGLYFNDEIYGKLQFSDEEINFLIYIHKKEIIRSIHRKNLMTKLPSDIMLQIIFHLFIIDYLKTNQIDNLKRELRIKDLDEFLKFSANYLVNSVKNDLDLEILLNFMNHLFNFINHLEDVTQ